jgi:hypothetical protein
MAGKPPRDIDSVLAIGLAVRMIPLMWISKSNPNYGDTIQRDFNGECRSTFFPPLFAFFPNIHRISTVF